MENKSQIIIYQTEKGETRLEVRLQNETVWLTQKLMAELFQTTVANINIHPTLAPVFPSKMFKLITPPLVPVFPSTMIKLIT